MQASHSREKTKRPISEKVKLGMKSLLSKANSLWGATNRLQDPSLTLKVLFYIKSIRLLFIMIVLFYYDYIFQVLFIFPVKESSARMKWILAVHHCGFMKKSKRNSKGWHLHMELLNKLNPSDLSLCENSPGTSKLQLPLSKKPPPFRCQRNS